MRVTADRIAIVRARAGLGDMLCAIPALRAIRGTAPRAHITLIGLPSARWVLDRFPSYVDELLDFPGFPGLSDDPIDAGRIVRFLAEAQERRFDVAIQLHGDGVASNAFTELLGARRVAGRWLIELPCPDRELFITHEVSEPEPQRLVRVVENLGARPTRGAELEFPVSDADVAELGRHELPDGRYACLFPGGRDPDNCWPEQFFAAVGDALAARGLHVVLAGTDAEAGAIAAVADAMQAQTRNLAGALSLGAAAALLRDAALVVCNNTGISHLAAALATPSVVVFPPDTDAERWAPLDRELHRPVGGDEMVTVDEVLGQADDLLAADAEAA